MSRKIKGKLQVVAVFMLFVVAMAIVQGLGY